LEVRSLKINERILKEIRKNCEKDEAVGAFLIDVLFEEAENPDMWRWKDIYNKLIDKHIKKGDE